MSYFVKVVSDAIVACQRADAAPEGWIALPEGVPEGAAALRYYRSGEDWLVRPELDLSSIVSPASPVSADLTAVLPEGTVIEVYETDGGTGLALVTDRHIELPDPAVYTLEFDPPFPYRPATLRVETI